MSDYNVQPPPRKKCKIALANNATRARANQKTQKCQRVQQARQARYPNNTGSISAARNAKQKKQEMKQKMKLKRKIGRSNQSQAAMRVQNDQSLCSNDIKTLIKKLNEKLNEYLQLDTIDASILYVNIC